MDFKQEWLHMQQNMSYIRDQRFFAYDTMAAIKL